MTVIEVNDGARVRVGIRIPPCAPLHETVEVARKAERLGFDQAWFPDSQLLWRDVFAVIAAVAMGTESIGLGTAVTNLVTRHPSVVASGARTLAEAAPGRFVLGLGVGSSSVAPIGLSPARQIELRERLNMVRTLLSGESWDFGSGLQSRLRDPGTPPPVVLAASGPKNLRLAGELADGLILLSGVSRDTLATSLALVEEGARIAGRSLSDLDIIVSTYGHITDDVERDCLRLKPICATLAQMGGAPFLALAGIHANVPPRVEEVYPDLVHAEDWDDAVRRCSEWITDDMALRFARAFCLFGSADEVADRVREIQAAGATSVLIQHVGSYSMPHELMESFAQALLLSSAK